MFDLQNLNPSLRKFWDNDEKEWVDIRLVPDDMYEVIRKDCGIKSQVIYKPNPDTKRMDRIDDINWTDERGKNFANKLVCYQIKDWHLLTNEGEEIPCTDENKLMLYRGAPRFKVWLDWHLDKLKEETEEFEEGELKN